MIEDADHEHWSGETGRRARPAVPASGYDNHNGLHRHSYHPAPHPVHYQVPVYYPHPQSYHQQPLPVYYSYPAMTYQPDPPTTLYVDPQYISARSGSAKQKSGHTYYQPAGPSMHGGATDNVYRGRTTAEVEQDFMTMAAREGACDKRKVAPVDAADDQLMWVIEPDGKQVLRRFMDIKKLEGEWKADPRFENSYYFLCDQEKD